MQSGLVAGETPANGGYQPVEESPLEAFFAASNWSREDVELALDALQVGLLLLVIIQELNT